MKSEFGMGKWEKKEGEKVGSENFEVASWNAAFDELRRDKVGKERRWEVEKVGS